MAVVDDDVGIELERRCLSAAGVVLAEVFETEDGSEKLYPLDERMLRSVMGKPQEWTMVSIFQTFSGIRQRRAKGFAARRSNQVQRNLPAALLRHLRATRSASALRLG
ncbi:hypothetical protein CDN98_11040 [Roseateles terrae]|nr:hypothetical protein CDN98_11040 [Roseateles terrae]